MKIQCARCLIVTCAVLRDSDSGCSRHAPLCKRRLEPSFQIHHDVHVRLIRPGSDALCLATTLTHHSIVYASLADPSLQIIDRHVNCGPSLVPQPGVLTNFTRFATTIPCLSTVWVVVSQLFQLAISSDRLSSYTGPPCRPGTTISEVYIPDRTILAFHRLWSSFFDERYISRMDAQMSMTDSPKIPAEKHERPHTLLHRRSRHTDFECKWTQAWK